MIRYLFLSLLLLMCLHIKSQTLLRGKIMDENNKAILFATVSDTKGNGCVCDSAGYFSLKIFKNELPENIIIQALGYESDTIKFETFKNLSVVKLREKKIGITEVRVNGQDLIENKSTVSSMKINAEEIETQNPVNIAGILQNKAGFTNKSGYQVPITLRGLSGKRLLVLRNGMQRFSSYPAGYMSHTINIYDLERIDIEKGAASVTYGAGAIAGIINMVDKSPFQPKGFNMKLIAGYGSVNEERNFLSYAGWTNEKFAIKAGGRLRKAENFKYPNGKLAKNSFYEDKDFTVSSGYRINDNQEIVVYGDFHKGGPWGKPLGFNGTKYMRVSTNKEISNNLSLKYTSKNKSDKIKGGIHLFYSDESRELLKKFYAAAGYTLSYVETTHFSDYYYGARAYIDIDYTPSYSCSMGAESYHFHISTPTDFIDYIDEVDYSNRVSHNARSYISGFYLENRFKLSLQSSIIAGFRYNLADVFEGDVYSSNQEQECVSHKEAISGQLALLCQPIPNTSLKINLARSFRMPETTELYTDNYTSNGIVYGNSSLKPEYCYSMDFCINYHRSWFSFEISPFFWLLDNLITKEELKGLPGTNYTYSNIDKARLFGGEAAMAIKHSFCSQKDDQLKINFAAAYLNGTEITESTNVLTKGEPLDYVPPFNIKSEISYNISFNHKIHYYAMLRSVYYSEQTRLGESTYATPAYLIFNADAGISIPTLHSMPTVRFSVSNMTNKEYYTYQSYLPAEGRDYRIFLTFNI